MTIAKPEIGELVKTVIELVDTVNEGGTPNLSNVVTENSVHIEVTGENQTLDLLTTGIGTTVVIKGEVEAALISQADNSAVTIQARGVDSTVNVEGTSISLEAEEGDSYLILDTNGVNLGGDPGITIGSQGDLGITATQTFNLTGSVVNLTGTANSGVAINLQANGTEGSVLIQATDNVYVTAPSGELWINGSSISFFNVAPVARPTGVAVTVEAIHAALKSLGLIDGP